MTARTAMAAAQAALRAAGLTDPRCARLLLEHALGMQGAALLAALDATLSPATQAAFESAVARAAAGEPLQYVLGSWDFYGRPFRCDRRALIPRADTETLVEAALEDLRPRSMPHTIDVGSGTGCVGITLKLECPAAQVTLCDISPDALALAAENAALLGADVELVQADLKAGLPGGPYDIIVSNPPYINAADMAALPAQVAAHEPHQALYGGPDGLDLVRALAAHSPNALRPGGAIFIEIGYDQSAAAQSILRAALGNARAIRDLCGVERVVTARKEDNHAGTKDQ